MRGGYVHNNVLLLPVLTQCRALGAGVSLEHRVRVGKRYGAIDIFADFGSRRLAIELETSHLRVPWDIEKARALNVEDLLIPVPSAVVAQACRRVVRRELATQGSSGMGVYVLTLPNVHQWLSNYSRLISTSIEAPASKTCTARNLNHI
jgi:hypothetical protein